MGLDRYEQAVRREYSRLASDYDRKWAYYVRAAVRETVERLDFSAADKLLDLGCGTAALLEALSPARSAVKFVGADLSMEMLQVARKKPGAGGKLVAAQAQRLPFVPASFDIVVSCNSFHFWRSPRESLSEIARVLKPGGKVVITDWCDDYFACRVCDLFLRIFDRAHFKTYGRRECEDMLRASGYRNISIDRYKIDWLWGLMTARGSLRPIECVKTGTGESRTSRRQ